MLLCVSANHRDAGFSLLERLSGAPVDEVEEALRAVPGLTGLIVLSTCNRFEVYLDLASADSIPEVWSALAAGVGVDPQTLRSSLRTIVDADVPSYLFSVSSGLESVVVGEGEIAGQVRRSLEHAREGGLTSGALEHLFQAAATTSKGVKAHTEIAGNGRSLVKFALELAESEISDWSGANALLIGTGAYAGASLKALEERGVRGIGVFSPSGRAHTFAERYDVRPVERRALPEALAGADLVITCTNSERYVLSADLLRTTRLAPGRSERQLIIDLGMPRNVDPLAGKVTGISLLDLETLRLHAPLEDLSATELARCIVARAATTFAEQLQETTAASQISAFRSLVTGRAEAEIAKNAARSGTLDSETAMRRLANALLHDPTLRIKELARAGRADEAAWALELLFGIPADDSASPAALGCPGGAATASGCPVTHDRAAGDGSHHDRSPHDRTNRDRSPQEKIVESLEL